ncbi:MAG: GNAT family N-acetyltransferase [Anaerolineaceae bacterium]|nr:GNAT family N-acetyltransferase [Anaerolineaceae bacterium]
MLIGKRVRLRAIERMDLELYVKWLNDPEVRRHLTIYQPMSMAQEETWYENNLKNSLNEQPLAIEIDKSGKWTLIGNIGLMDFDYRIQSAELGLFIGDKREWGKGYGKDAICLMLTHAFNSLNLNRVFLRVYEDNSRGIRLYEKIGFIHEGRLREAVFDSGSFKDVLIMSILRSEWKDCEEL